MKIVLFFIIFLINNCIAQFLNDISPIAFNKNNTIEIPLTVLLSTHCLLEVSDVYSTYNGINNGAIESNKVSQFLINNHLLIPTKILISTGFNYIVKWIYTRDKTFAYIISGIAVGLMIYVNWNNYHIISISGTL